MKGKMLWTSAMIFVLLLVLAGCNKSKKEETIRFAVMGPMTGDGAMVGAQQEYAVHLAVQEINAAGGINGKKLEYDVYDDQLNTNQAVICSEKIAADDSYRFVVSPTSSGCTMAAYPALEEADIAIVSGINTSDRITEMGYTNYVRVCARAGAMLEQILGLMRNSFNIKKPANIYSSAETDSFNHEVAAKYLKDNFDIEFVYSAQIQPDTEKDYTAHITNSKDRDADAVIIFGEYSPAALFLKQRYSLGWNNVPVFSLSGCSNPQLIEIAGSDAAEGFFSMSAFDWSNPKPQVQKFVADYTKLSGFSPSEQAAGAYDAVFIMAQALGNPTAASLKGKALIDWLKSNCKYSGIMVDVDGFDRNGDNPAAKALIVQVSNGKFGVY
jgi:branched-chain amino acid transport system substrate-binding protein